MVFNATKGSKVRAVILLRLVFFNTSSISFLIYVYMFSLIIYYCI